MGEELALAFALLIDFAGESDSHSSGDVSDALVPHILVDLSIDAHVLGEHVLLSETLNLSKSSRGLLLELNFVASCVQVDGVVAGRRCKFFFGSSVLFSHLYLV